MNFPSPLLSRPGAVAAPTESALAWHYGDPLAEQRAAVRAVGLVDRSTDGLVAVTGGDSLELLHLLSSQVFAGLPVGSATEALWLSPRGHVEHRAVAAVLPDAVYLHTTPGAAGPLAEYLQSMRFRMEVAARDVTADFASVALVGPGAAHLGAEGMTPPAPGTAQELDGGGFVLHRADDSVQITVPREVLAARVTALVSAGARPIGTWAATALRVAARQARFGVDSDEKTLPHEIPGWLAAAVHLDKGCYRGQETVARIENIGAPPRRLVLLNLDGSAERLPAAGAEVTDAEGRVVGRVGSAAYHYEEGPIALALVKRTIAPGVGLVADGVDALIDPADVVPPGPKVRYDRSQFIDLGRR